MENKFVDNPTVIAPAKYVSFVILRQTQDYLILRTEADKNINSVETPKDYQNDEPFERVAFLASKQKAVERRQAQKIYRKYNSDVVCHLKDNLCMQCPVCILNGGVGSTSDTDVDYSIRSRVLYQTSYSTMDIADLIETRTFNAIEDKTQTTGQALNSIEQIKPNTLFVSVITLHAPTYEEAKFVYHYINNTKRYGAETRGLGVVENNIIGMIISDSEKITALDLTLKSGNTNNYETVKDNIISHLEDNISEDELYLDIESNLKYEESDLKTLEEQAQEFISSIEE